MKLFGRLKNKVNLLWVRMFNRCIEHDWYFVWKNDDYYYLCGKCDARCKIVT